MNERARRAEDFEKELGSLYANIWCVFFFTRVFNSANQISNNNKSSTKLSGVLPLKRLIINKSISIKAGIRIHKFVELSHVGSMRISFAPLSSFSLNFQ